MEHTPDCGKATSAGKAGDGASSYPFEMDCGVEAITGLQPPVLQALRLSAMEYSQATGQRLTVTSGRRTLRRMAELMASFSMEQLEGMYCRNGYPQYIQAIREARASGPVDANETYRILKNRTEGYISMHLCGGAVDIATEGLDSQETLCAILQKNGFSTLDENELGIGCIHASFRSAQKTIVKD